MPFLYGRNWTRHELTQHIGHLDQIAGIRPLEGADGNERGNRLLEVWTGTGLQFHVLPDRALDITTCTFRGQSLAWRSAQGDPHPAYYDPNGLEWLRTFPGGLLITCGLDHYGAPSVDQGVPYGLHGRIGHQPAKQVNVRTFWDGDEYRLEITGLVRQFRVFGENLTLARRITTALGSNQITLEDTVTNEALVSQPHMILYHFNLGFPLLSAETELHADVRKTTPRDANAEPGLGSWHKFQPPTPGYQEQVFVHEPIPDAEGWAQAEVRNPALGLGLRVRFDTATLPYLWQWKQMGQGTYVLGIEPGNARVMTGRGTARERGMLPELAAGESRRYRLTLEATQP